MNKVFDAFRICITEGKCTNTDCPYKVQCNISHNHERYIQIPKVLALDVLNELKEKEATIEELKGFINGFSKEAVVPVRCNDCKYWNITTASFPTKGFCGCYHGAHEGDWFCADGERKSADEKLMEEMDADPLG